MENEQYLGDEHVTEEERLTGELHAVMGYLDQAAHVLNQIADELENRKERLPEQDRTAIASTLERIDTYAHDFHQITSNTRDRLGLGQQS